MKKNSLEEKLKRIFQTDAQVLVVYLFGSTARESTSPLSDIDVAILLKRKDSKHYFDKKVTLLKRVMSVLETEAVDLIVLNEAPVDLRYNIICEGKIIYCKDEDMRVNFEVKTMGEYFDFEPVINQYDEYFIKKVSQKDFIK